MYNIKTVNKISSHGMDVFGKDYNVGDDISNPDAVVVRSASMHETDLPSSLRAIARAGAGYNNIPVDRCTEQGIVVFNTPGANANAVKELIVAALMLSSRKVVDAINWAQTLKGKGDEVEALVEKGKSAFTGPEVYGKSIGVVGLGATGVLVANAAEDLGMTVYGYDPYLSVTAAWRLSRKIKRAATMDEIFENCDYLSIHVPLNKETADTVRAETIAKMKDGVRILNMSRAGLVNNDDIKKAILDGKVACYVTDFPSDDLLGVDGVVAIPHLGASTPESEDNCARMAAEQIVDFLETGNIKNSVNLPDMELPRSGGTRLTLVHKNVPNMVTQISSVLSGCGLNIDNMLNKSRGDIAYTLIDVSGEIVAADLEKISKIDGVIKQTVII